jgi:hypothetical protein
MICAKEDISRTLIVGIPSILGRVAKREGGVCIPSSFPALGENTKNLI